MNFFLLAGGYGKRAEPLSIEKPKPLFPLGGTPLMRLILAQLRLSGIHKGWINLHHLAEQIPPEIETGMEITFLPEKELSGSRILSRVADFAQNGLLVVNGDVFLEIPSIKLFQELEDSKADGILLVKPASSGYPSLQIRDGFFYGVESTKPKASHPRWMYTGVAVLTPRILASIRDANFFHTLEREKFRIRCMPYNGIWLEIGTPAMYRDAAWEFEKYCHRTPVNIPSKNVRLDPNSRVVHSIIWENTAIGSGCEIENSIITAGLTLEKIHAVDCLITAQGIFPLIRK